MRALTLLAKDARVSAREAIATYLLLGPLVLVLLTRLALPFFTEPRVRFAVAEGLDEGLVAALEARGEVERLPDRDAVAARVTGFDDVTGLAPGVAGVEVLVEGNEPPRARALPGQIVDAVAARGTAAEVAVTAASIGRPLPLLHGWLAALMGYMAAVIGGVVMAFTMIDERSSGTLQALQVSPMSWRELLGAKTLGVALVALTLGPASAVAMLAGVVPLEALRPLPLLLAVASAIPSGLLIGALIGVKAEDQLSAVGLLKGLLTVFSGLPFAGLVVSGPWRAAFLPFTMHHATQAVHAALHPGASPWASIALAWATGLPLLALVAALLKRRLAMSP